MGAYYPPVGFYFKVTFQGIDGVTDDDIRFQEVGGLTMEVELDEIRDGAAPQFAYKVPKRAKYSNLVLKRGMLKDSALIAWFDNAVDSYFNQFNISFSPCTVIVELMDENGDPLSTWQVNNAFPVKWQMSDFKANANEVVVETIELAYQNFKRL
ncbi:phage tail-like protein [Dyadobacter jejuensis]|uniref:Phage tail-like protein n=1 Tax=Dyadobacter jejuensis TaxID=1082580 RepID=A0A316AJQ1_9BACT|nr:phage tail protein [Dyadobacter jejuensis]PWJ57469.1 phage tail-like protein [Dyadobacter jejuensis]